MMHIVYRRDAKPLKIVRTLRFLRLSGVLFFFKNLRGPLRVLRISLRYHNLEKWVSSQ